MLQTRRRRPVPASALLPVIRSVALDCLEPFFVFSRGLITRRRGIRVVNAAADAEAAEAAVAAVSAGGIAPAASDRAITAETARARSAIAAAPAIPTEGLIRREVDGDPGERGGAVVVEAAAVAVAGPAALTAEAAQARSTEPAGGILPAAAITAAPGPAVGTSSAEARLRGIRR